MIPQNGSHGRRGGSIAVYGNETLRTIVAVTNISRLGRDAGGGSNNYYSQSEHKDSESGFAGILASEQRKSENSQTITLKNNTYSNKGTATAFFVMMRDYTYQK